MSTGKRQMAVVTEWNEERGYGRAQGRKGYLRCHHKDLPGACGDLLVGEKISFIEIKTEVGGNAMEIEFIDRHGEMMRPTLPDVRGGERLRQRFPRCETREQLIACGLVRPAQEDR